MITEEIKKKVAEAFGDEHVEAFVEAARPWVGDQTVLVADASENACNVILVCEDPTYVEGPCYNILRFFPGTKRLADKDGVLQPVMTWHVSADKSGADLAEAFQYCLSLNR